MARNIQLATQKDFTGGLNLRADQFQLAANESPDMLNVDVDPRGGMRLRRGTAPYAGPVVDATIHSIMQLHVVGGVHQLLVGHGAKVSYSTGGAWTLATGAFAAATALTAAQFKDALYMQNGTNAPIKWTGAVATALAQAWANDFALPGSGNMPIGKAVASHNGHVFVANTLESAVRFPNRIRWSHPNFPESYRSLDFIDIDTGVDGDEIVSIVPFQDHLLIFKRRSTYVLYGFDADSFQLQPISREVGAASPQAAVATPGGIYFFSTEIGAMLWNGRSLEWKFEALVPTVDEGDILSSRAAEVALGWINNRVWVSVPWQASAARVFVLDPTLTKSGSWTKYDLDIGPMMEYSSSGADHRSYTSVGARVVELDVKGQPWDDFGPGAVHIASYYSTPWFDMGEPARKKRFRRPTFVFVGDTADVVAVDVFRDYDQSQVVKTFYESISKPSAFQAVWNGFNWDDGSTWAPEGKSHVVQQGSALGLSRAVQMKFTGPQGNANWGLDSLSLTFIPRKVRG